MTADLGAVLLAGGAGSRLGGVDKAALLLDGEPLLARALTALQGLEVVVEVVVVGPHRGLTGVQEVREAPPRSGPASAVVAGLGALGAVREVLLLAVDVPRLPAALPLLLRAATGADGVVAVDADGRAQWLLGRYRADALRAAATALGDATGRSLRALVGGLDVATLRLPPGVELDVDTVADAVRAGVVLPGEETR